MDCACVSYYIGSTPPFCSTYNENERNEAPNHLNDPTKWLMLFTKSTNECTFGNGNGYNTHTHTKNGLKEMERNTSIHICEGNRAQNDNTTKSNALKG